MAASDEDQDGNTLPEKHVAFHISWKEAVLAFFLTTLYLLARLIFPSQTTLLLIAGMGFALWLVFRASHFAVEGLESVGAYAGLSFYIIGVLSSLASNTPEAVVSGLTAWRGIVTATPELVEIAVLSVVMAAGFNILLLGCVVVLAARDKGYINVPREVVEDDADLLRWTIVAMALLFALGTAHYIASIGESTASPITLPSLAGLFMVLSYVLYAIFAITKPVDPGRKRIAAIPRHTKRTAAILTIVGFVGIFIAGEVMTSTIELALETVPFESFGIVTIEQQIVIMAMIVGAAGAIPEHGIALLAAAKGKANIAIGNTLGGTTQILLLIVGGVAIFLPFPLNVEILLQFAIAAGSLWFLKRAMTDDQRIDLFEGSMVLLMQCFVFVLMLTPV